MTTNLKLPRRNTDAKWEAKIGQRFHRWTVIGKGVVLPPHTSRSLLCRCDCGTVKLVYFPNLQRGQSKGCVKCAYRGRSPLPPSLCPLCGSPKSRKSLFCYPCSVEARTGNPKTMRDGKQFPETHASIAARYNTTKQYVSWIRIHRTPTGSYREVIEYFEANPPHTPRVRGGSFQCPPPSQQTPNSSPSPGMTETECSPPPPSTSPPRK